MNCSWIESFSLVIEKDNLPPPLRITFTDNNGLSSTKGTECQLLDIFFGHFALRSKTKRNPLTFEEGHNDVNTTFEYQKELNC